MTDLDIAVEKILDEDDNIESQKEQDAIELNPLLNALPF